MMNHTDEEGNQKRINVNETTRNMIGGRGKPPSKSELRVFSKLVFTFLVQNGWRQFRGTTKCQISDCQKSANYSVLNTTNLLCGKHSKQISNAL